MRGHGDMECTAMQGQVVPSHVVSFEVGQVLSKQSPRMNVLIPCVGARAHVKRRSAAWSNARFLSLHHPRTNGVGLDRSSIPPLQVSGSSGSVVRDLRSSPSFQKAIPKGGGSERTVDVAANLENHTTSNERTTKRTDLWTSARRGCAMAQETKYACLMRVMMRGTVNFLLAVALAAYVWPRSSAGKLLRGDWSRVRADEWSVLILCAAIVVALAAYIVERRDKQKLGELEGTWKVMPWLSDGLEDILRFHGCKEEEVLYLIKEELVHCISMDATEKKVKIVTLRHGRVKSNLEATIGEGFFKAKGNLCQSQFTHCAGHLIQEDITPLGYKVVVDRYVDGEFLVAMVHSEYGKSKSVRCKRVFARIPDP